MLVTDWYVGKEMCWWRVLDVIILTESRFCHQQFLNYHQLQLSRHQHQCDQLRFCEVLPGLCFPCCELFSICDILLWPNWLLPPAATPKQWQAKYYYSKIPVPIQEWNFASAVNIQSQSQKVHTVSWSRPWCWARVEGLPQEAALSQSNKWIVFWWDLYFWKVMFKG